MLFLEYPPCSTCKKAKNWLIEHNIVFQSRHIKEDKVLTGFRAAEWEQALL